ncbi:hypothetical protein [Teichococcus vastitatis]|uniref:Sulphur transport domain-containing protein n=2 Tax=Teichococcus vastitatis TaxID=2307076 RepID=A0ABS9WDQ0_9PROT|nr:hypothetical protein [Pseudoroseomonas vastitatis]MCI0757118.1 hypothetical protein [Pseudoroseomonas vastitatis]
MTPFGDMPLTWLAVWVGDAAFMLGGAIQFGTICAVRAAEELVEHRRADSFLGFFECSLWALLVAWASGVALATPWAPPGWLCLDAVLFGAGAAVNGGCAFGSVARLGEG